MVALQVPRRADLRQIERRHGRVDASDPANLCKALNKTADREAGAITADQTVRWMPGLDFGARSSLLSLPVSATSTFPPAER